MWRLGLITLIVAPSVRQYYTYVTDTRCPRLGTQCWVFVAIAITETLICIKFGSNIFAQTQLRKIFLWLLMQFIFSMICVSLCVIWAKYRWNHVNNIVEEYLSRFDQRLTNENKTK
ncbi:hypothetical protein SSS_09905 [Sarcoptes scabiei]|nr:hypothetical protein SSS_09905 [Sarcoptes scabiei]